MNVNSIEELIDDNKTDAEILALVGSDDRTDPRGKRIWADADAKFIADTREQHLADKSRRRFMRRWNRLSLKHLDPILKDPTRVVHKRDIVQALQAAFQEYRDGNGGN